MYRHVCALESIPRCDQQCEGNSKCGSNRSIHDSASLIHWMISSVHVSTEHREHAEVTVVSFDGTKDRHAQVSAESVTRKFRVWTGNGTTDLENNKCSVVSGTQFTRYTVGTALIT